jgi:hypothetical protein
MVFVFTFSGREQLHLLHRKTWGAYVKNFVTFSTRELADIKAAVTRAARPEWEAAWGDGHNAAFAPYALQHLYDIGRARGIKYFINFDDDAPALWPSMMAYLREYQDAHGGHYPYSACGYDADSAVPNRHLYGWERSGSELHKARLVYDGGMGAPSGMAYGFNLSALHDYMGAIETVPILNIGDAQQGAFMAAAGRALEERALGQHTDMLGVVGNFADIEHGGWEDTSWWRNASLASLYGLQEDGSPYPDRMPARTSALHKVKLPHQLELAMDAYYSHFGMPKCADLPPEDPHKEEEGPCTYAPEGEHMYTWGEDGAGK